MVRWREGLARNPESPQIAAEKCPRREGCSRSVVARGRVGIMYGPAGGMVTAAGIVERTTMTTTTRSTAPRNYLFTSESVTEGHPDKICDQVSDAILDALLAKEAQLQAEGYVAPSGAPANVDNVRCACETFVTTGTVVVAGEVRTEAYLDVQTIARDVIRRIGYDRAKYGFDAETCGVINMIHEQSPDINRGVVARDEQEQGAGDQGMMFGYACTETAEYMPLPIALSHQALRILAQIRREGNEMKYLRPDAKSQFTVEYSEDGKPLRVHTIVISTQHDEFIKDDDAEMQRIIRKDVENVLLPRLIGSLPEQTAALFKDGYILHVNPTGKFVIGGPHGDTGLTGRKIVVDSYGGMAAHGGGAFSGKDSSKVDRSAAYAARYIAKNMVAAGVADRMVVQIAYAIGVARPLSIFVDTYGTSKTGKSDSEIAEMIGRIFDLRPSAIVEKFQLLNPIYEPTAAYGHFGREPYRANVEFSKPDGEKYVKEVQFFGWELLDSVDMIKEAFGLK